MHLQELPPVLIGRILDTLDTKERSKLSSVSKGWREASESCLRTIKLRSCSLQELDSLRIWLNGLAVRGHLAGTRELDLFWQGGIDVSLLLTLDVNSTTNAPLLQLENNIYSSGFGWVLEHFDQKLREQ